jgi:divalent metal cation (Fe/Co/Zn/Cd) transporter
MKRLLPFVASLLALAPLAAKAGYGYERADYAPHMAASFGMFGVGIMMLVGLVIGLVVLWVWMLLDALQREWPEKSTWIAILILSLFVGLHWLAALLYYVLVKQKNVGKMPAKKK